MEKVDIEKVWEEFALNNQNTDLSAVKEVLSTDNDKFVSMTPTEVSNCMLVLSRYKMLVHTKLNLIKAKINFLRRDLNLRTDIHAESTRFLSLEERRNLAISKDSKLIELHKKISLLELEKDQIDGVPEVIEGIISRLNNFRFQRNQENNLE